MKPIGTLPHTISSHAFLNTIGANLIVADLAFNITWMNASANGLLSKVAPLYGFKDAEALIGMNMDAFHFNPAHQKELMTHLKKAHRKRINIKDTYIADIVINPIKTDGGDIEGYIVLLLDVTTKAQEDSNRERLIQQLSVPILHVWDNIMAVPLIGDIDQDRFDMILSKLLDECQKKEAGYVILNLSEVTALTGGLNVQINKICSCMTLMGTECLIVGINPDLSYNMVKYEQHFDNLTFFSFQSALKHIFKKENIIQMK